MRVWVLITIMLLSMGCSNSPTDQGTSAPPLIVNGIVTANMEIGHGIFVLPTWNKGLYTPTVTLTRGTAIVYPPNAAIDPTGYVIIWITLTSMVGYEYSITLSQ